MDNQALIEMAKQIAMQQAEIDRLRSMLDVPKKSKKQKEDETKQRRLSLVTKLYRQQLDKAMIKYADRIEKLNKEKKQLGLPLFDTKAILEELLEPFK
ncbi:hypothetical protein BWD42_04265 [Sphingobacterium sp. CZ-UAM]|uniref:hypothetical protein n=1 Tax=Sphingobacterium sp. CZ-UAM TaxID=1933868 RepID=UPI0009869EAB|nr:hypothetical protein [Sphingobacterium sp. CZ-UAM]OOG19169.1 hypothetical protein BWD42_04265 [Sphingobacterium sp. CZ-UAM]